MGRDVGGKGNHGVKAAPFHIVDARRPFAQSVSGADRSCCPRNNHTPMLCVRSMSGYQISPYSVCESALCV